MRSGDCNFHRNQTFGRRIDHLFVYFWTSAQKFSILTARLNKSLSVSTSIQWEGISVLKHDQNFYSYCENNSLGKTLWWDMWAMMHTSKVIWIGIIVSGRAVSNTDYSVLQQNWRHAIVSYFQTDYTTIVWFYHDVWYWHIFAEFWHRLHWWKTLGLMPSNSHWLWCNAGIRFTHHHVCIKY